jgi:hypothetical protein
MARTRAPRSARNVQLAELPENIRGFGYVKWRNFTQTQEIKTRLIGRFRAMTADSKAGV